MWKFRIRKRRKYDKNYYWRKEFGNEKNKLVIQPIGIAVIEFLLKYCENLFKYEYTEDLENKLDLIAKGDLDWLDTCKNYNTEILEFVKPINKDIKKQEYKLDDNHYYIIGKYGPVIKYIQGDKTLFKSIKENLDHEAIKRGEYKLEDVIENENKSSEKLLGKYRDKDVYLKKGKFGLYIECGEYNKSIKFKKWKFNNLRWCKTIFRIKNNKEINETLSIRKKLWRLHIYKTPNMKKPQFYKLNTFEDDYKICSIETIKQWIKENIIYNYYNFIILSKSSWEPYHLLTFSFSKLIYLNLFSESENYNYETKEHLNLVPNLDEIFHI